MRLLLVENNLELAGSLVQLLSQSAYVVEHARSVEVASPLHDTQSDDLILQMDQTTSAHKILFGNQRKRRHNPNMDRRRHLCSYRYCEQTFPFAAQPL